MAPRPPRDRNVSKVPSQAMRHRKTSHESSGDGSDPAPRGVGRQTGRGLIGFLIAVVVVGYVGNALLKTYRVKNRADEIADFVYQTLQDAERAKLDVSVVKFRIVKKIEELGIPIANPEQIEVSREGIRWRVHFEWDDRVVLPGYTYPMHFEVDKTWTSYSE